MPRNERRFRRLISSCRCGIGPEEEISTVINQNLHKEKDIGQVGCAVVHVVVVVHFVVVVEVKILVC